MYAVLILSAKSYPQEALDNASGFAKIKSGDSPVENSITVLNRESTLKNMVNKKWVVKCNCQECKKEYKLLSEDLDKYNFYWIMNSQTRKVIPAILCPDCTNKFSKLPANF